MPTLQILLPLDTYARGGREYGFWAGGILMANSRFRKNEALAQRQRHHQRQGQDQ